MQFDEEYCFYSVSLYETITSESRCSQFTFFCIAWANYLTKNSHHWGWAEFVLINKLFISHLLARLSSLIWFVEGSHTLEPAKSSSFLSPSRCRWCRWRSRRPPPPPSLQARSADRTLPPSSRLPRGISSCLLKNTKHPDTKFINFYEYINNCFFYKAQTQHLK